jgi:accessory gene regulator B
MREWFVNTNINYITTKNNYDERKLKIIKYGLECIYTTITKSSVIVLLSIILNIFYETLLLISFYSLLRIFGFGIHATSNTKCWIVSILTYTIIPLIIKTFDLIYPLNISLEIIFIIGFIAWAPADTKKRPLIHKEKRTTDKIIVVTTALVYLIYSIFYINIFSECIFYGMLIEFICINPLTYKIFKQPYKNYLSFN